MPTIDLNDKFDDVKDDLSIDHNELLSIVNTIETTPKLFIVPDLLCGELKFAPSKYDVKFYCEIENPTLEFFQF